MNPSAKNPWKVATFVLGGLLIVATLSAVSLHLFDSSITLFSRDENVVRMREFVKNRAEIFAYYEKNTTRNEDGSFSLGVKDAPLKVTEYSDFQCPFCEAFFTRTMPAFLTDFIQKGSMFFTYRDFPLDGHYNAFPASEAVHCAGDQNRFYAMHDMLFSFSDLWTDARDAQPVFEKFADALGLDTDKFRACMNQHAFSGAIHASLSEANALGITGTPGFSVNGFKVSGAQSVDYFKKVFEIVQNPKLLKDYQDAEKKAEDAANQRAKVQK